VVDGWGKPHITPLSSVRSEPCRLKLRVGSGKGEACPTVILPSVRSNPHPNLFSLHKRMPFGFVQYNNPYGRNVELKQENGEKQPACCRLQIQG
jgi:hypothetical protein